MRAGGGRSLVPGLYVHMLQYLMMPDGRPRPRSETIVVDRQAPLDLVGGKTRTRDYDATPTGAHAPSRNPATVARALCACPTA